MFNVDWVSSFRSAVSTQHFFDAFKKQASSRYRPQKLAGFCRLRTLRNSGKGNAWQKRCQVMVREEFSNVDQKAGRKSITCGASSEKLPPGPLVHASTSPTCPHRPGI